MKQQSSGIILHRLNEETKQVEFFVCTPDGPFWRNRELWNFPKGHIEDGEIPLTAALREFEEETSIKLDFDASFYRFHGFIKQNIYKIVAVYSREWFGEDTSNCVSNFTTSNFKGKEIKHREIKDYKWMTYDELVERGIKCYLPIYKDIIKVYCDKNN